MEATDYFREQAQECRRLAGGLSPSRDRDALLMLAVHYEREAKRATQAAPAAPGPPLRSV